MNSLQKEEKIHSKLSTTNIYSSQKSNSSICLQIHPVTAKTTNQYTFSAIHLQRTPPPGPIQFWELGGNFCIKTTLPTHDIQATTACCKKKPSMNSPSKTNNMIDLHESIYLTTKHANHRIEKGLRQEHHKQRQPYSSIIPV